MSATIANIVLTGICMFVRPDTHSNPHSALFMEGRTDRKGNQYPDAMKHHVFLIINSDLHQIDGDGLTYETMSDSTGSNYWIFTLDDSLVEVASVMQEDSLCAHDMNQIASLADVWPRIIGGAHPGSPDLQLPHRTAALKYRVNSRFALKAGELAPSYVNSDQWLFQPGVTFHAAKQGWIPQEVTLSTTLDEDALELSVRDVMSGTLNAVISVKPNSGTQINVVLANVPHDDLLPNSTCANYDCQANPDHPCCTDHHFELYYRAYDDPPDHPPVPHRLPTKVSPPPLTGSCEKGQVANFFRVGGPNCGPEQYP